MAETKKQKSKKQIMGIIVWFACCIAIGVALGITLAKSNVELSDEMLLSCFIGFLVWMYLHIIFHEGGHLICGLLTGYSFVSFRVGSFMWEKQKDGKVHFCRFSLAGTGGQCLMGPPEYKDGKFPYVLYNLGGGLMNFLLAAVGIALLVMLPMAEWLQGFLGAMAFNGIFIGAMNLIPIRKLNNDGSNIMEISKSAAAKRAFWLQMRMNEEAAKGVRLKDMPAEWFETITKNRKNIMVTSIDVFSANRMMDRMELDAAEEKMVRLMKEDYLAGIYKSLMVFELSSLELLKGEKSVYTDKTEEPKLQRFEKAMKKFPSILRWQYIKAKILDQNAEKAEEIRKTFDNMAQTYPHPCELESERQLMQMADEKAKSFSSETL